MSYQTHNVKADNKMNSEQFTQVFEAILERKYSWACVLILRFAGYNPLDYIPHRTYSRLIKENAPESRRRGRPVSRTNSWNQPSEAVAVSASHRTRSSEIADLSYLEGVGQQRRHIRGGSWVQWVGSSLRGCNPINIKSMQYKEYTFMPIMGEPFQKYQ